MFTDFILFALPCFGVTVMSVIVTIMEIAAGNSTGETWRRLLRLEILIEMILVHFNIKINDEEQKPEKPTFDFDKKRDAQKKEDDKL